VTALLGLQPYMTAAEVRVPALIALRKFLRLISFLFMFSIMFDFQPNNSAAYSMFFIIETEKGHFFSQFPQAIQSEPFVERDS